MKNSDVYSRKIGRVLTVKAIPELITSHLACEQALRGALAAVWEKEGELATTSLEFEYLHRKSRCDMLIGGDDICNDVITIHTCFSMFAYIRAPFRLAPIGGNLTAQSTGSHTGSHKLSFIFPPRRQSAPERFLAGFVAFEMADKAKLLRSHQQ